MAWVGLGVNGGATGRTWRFRLIVHVHVVIRVVAGGVVRVRETELIEQRAHGRRRVEERGPGWRARGLRELLRRSAMLAGTALDAVAEDLVRAACLDALAAVGCQAARHAALTLRPLGAALRLPLVTLTASADARVGVVVAVEVDPGCHGSGTHGHVQ